MLVQGDSALLPFLDKQFHCVVTSPPYWGLRKYSGVEGRGMFPNLGLEPTPDEFVHNMVIIFREVRRVLRDDGVVWLNLGDSFAGSGGENANTGLQGGNTIKANSDDGTRSGLWRSNPRKTKIQQGNLMMMPHRVAIALQTDGWIIRNDAVWWKRNPMPESVKGWRFQISQKIKDTDPRGNEGEKRNATLGKQPQRDHDGRDFAQPEYEYGEDYELKKGSWRHTRAHEYVFMLTKKMKYWSNQESVRQSLAETSIARVEHAWHLDPNHPQFSEAKDVDRMGERFAPLSGRSPRSVLDVPQYTIEELWALFVEYMTNPADVLDVTTVGYKGAHYATFPPNLIAPLIRATCPRWTCPVCGQGWSPVVDAKSINRNELPRDHPEWRPMRYDDGKAGDGIYAGEGQRFHRSRTLGYRPTCDHPHTIDEAVPGLVLDPFVGSGTTVMVANELLRKGVGLDVSMEYLDEQAKVRTKSGIPTNQLDDLPMFDDE